MRRPQMRRGFSLRALSLVVTVFLMAGCSLFASRSQSIGVSSSPPGAQVLATGKSMGTTPLHFEVQRGDNLLLEVRKSGYQTQFRTSSKRMSTLGIIDLIGGCIWLVPFFGLLSDAAWEHDPSEVGVTIEPENNVTPTR